MRLRIVSIIWLVCFVHHAHRSEQKKWECRVKRMFGISENMLWLIVGKDIRNDSGNGNVVWIDKIIVSLIDIFECLLQVWSFDTSRPGSTT